MTRTIAYTVMVLSAAGIVLCLGFYLIGVTRIYLVPARVLAVLLVGIFPIWLPTVILMNRLTRDFKRKDLWKAALRGCPPWMRIALWVVVGCAFVSFFIPVVSAQRPRDPPQTFMLFPITFYAVSFCVTYSLIKVEKFDATRRCLNGHAMSPLAKFCEECGAPAAPDCARST